jgi:hypothetical protein
MTGAQPFECEAVSAQGPFAYYALTTAPESSPAFVYPPPESGVVPNPDVGAIVGSPISYPVGQVTSQAMSVGPYGSATPVTSGRSAYNISALQYAKNSSYFVSAGAGAGPGPGQAPNKAPFNLSLIAPVTTSIIPVVFDTAGIVGAPALIYQVFYQQVSPPSQFWNSAPAFRIINPNTPTTLYTASIAGLAQSTIYKFYASVKNGFGEQLSPITTFTTAGGTTPPSGSLSTPVNTGATLNSQITVQFSPTGVTGNPVPAYYIYWGLSPTTVTNQVLASLVPGTTSQYRGTATGLTVSTDYYFIAEADNGNAPPLKSSVAGPFQTGGSNSPSKGPPAPVVSGVPTATTISVTVDVTGITGTPTPTYTLLYGTTTACTQTFGPMSVAANTASATVTGLTPNTTYYFKANASNGVPTDKGGIVSAGISTATDGTPTAPSAVPGKRPLDILRNFTIPITDTTIDLTTSIVGIKPGNPLAQYKFMYGTLPVPVNDPNAISVPITATSTTQAFALPKVTGLNPNTKYYFQGVAFNGVSPDYTCLTINSYSTTGSGGNTPPSDPPTIPALSGSPTATTITMTFDTSGISGSPTMAYSLGFSTTEGGTYTYVPALLKTGTLYIGTVTDLTPNSTYYLKSKVSNTFPPDQISAASVPILTAPVPPTPLLQTNVVTPFLLQGPRFGSTPGAWTAIDYYINVGAVGATYEVGGTTATGQQVFASMYAGTVGDAGNVTGASPPCQYAGACVADQPFAALGGTGDTDYSSAYLGAVQSNMGSSGRVLACWGGFYADILGLFGPYKPAGYPGTAQPTSKEVVRSFLYNYCGVTAATNPLNWVRTNSSGNSGYTFYYDGLILDFENVGNGNPLNSFPYAQPATPPSSQDLIHEPQYPPYIQALADIPATYYEISPTLFLGNAPVSLSIVLDQGMTNICAANTALGTWFPFQTATVEPTAGAYNTSLSAALNHPSQLCYMDDIFVQFYNEAADYYLGGQYFTNLLACWGYVALEAQKLGKKKTKINLGLAKGNIIPGGSAPFKASAQGPTPPVNGQSGPPYTYWYPQYCTASPPNNTSNATYDTWPDTGPTKDPLSMAAAITDANTILRTAQNNQNLQPSDWVSGTGFWAGPAATTMAQSVYTAGNASSPGDVLPASQVYCWSDAYYPAPDPGWKTGSTFAVPIVNNL